MGWSGARCGETSPPARPPASCLPSCRRRGRTVEQDCLELVNGLPPEQQRMVASGFSSYAETLA